MISESFAFRTFSCRTESGLRASSCVLEWWAGRNPRVHLPSQPLSRRAENKCHQGAVIQRRKGGQAGQEGWSFTQSELLQVHTALIWIKKQNKAKHTHKKSMWIRACTITKSVFGHLLDVSSLYQTQARQPSQLSNYPSTESASSVEGKGCQVGKLH